VTFAPSGANNTLATTIQNKALKFTKPKPPVAASTSRRYELSNWDKFSINLPFGRGSVVWGEPIFIDSRASKREIEEKRQLLEKKLLETFEDSKSKVDNK